MSTMNISLPADQINFIDSLVVDFGYANRSELILLHCRFIKREPKVITLLSFPLKSPPISSRSKIIADFKATGYTTQALGKTSKMV